MRKEIVTSWDYMVRIIWGVSMPIENKKPELSRLLEILNYSVKEENSSITIKVPSYKVNVDSPSTIVADLIRFIGLDNIEMPDRFNIPYKNKKIMLVVVLVIVGGLIMANKIKGDRKREFDRISNMYNSVDFHDRQRKLDRVKEFYTEHPDWHKLSLLERRVIIEERIKKNIDGNGSKVN